jgi:hypothetical protein
MTIVNFNQPATQSVYNVTESSLVQIRQVKTAEEAKIFASQFIEKNNLPPCDSVYLDQSGNIVMKWNWGPNLFSFSEKYSKELLEDEGEEDEVTVTGIRIVISSDATSGYMEIDYWVPLWADDSHYTCRDSLEKFKFVL